MSCITVVSPGQLAMLLHGHEEHDVAKQYVANSGMQRT
jgi:hypothetical protein